MINRRILHGVLLPCYHAHLFENSQKACTPEYYYHFYSHHAHYHYHYYYYYYYASSLRMLSHKQVMYYCGFPPIALFVVRLAGGAGLLLLLLQLLHALLVGSGLLARVLASQLHGALVGTLVAETQVGHQTLDLGRLVALVAVVLELAAHHELADVVLLAQTEQLADVARTLRTQAAGLRGGLVGQTRNLLLALLHDHQVQNADVGTHDAATHGLALTLTLDVIRLG